MTSPDQFRFQVNLAGIIQILSKHLYSTPRVYLRELLQNSVDAITARRALGDRFESRVMFEVMEGVSGKSCPTLIVEDNGIGLTEEEVHLFMSTIGQSSKSGEFNPDRQTFIGQFGIGLLSCFVVSEEVVVVTRSARPGSVALEWRGKEDGTYSVRKLNGDFSCGTKVYLQCKPGSEEFFAAEDVLGALRHYGSLVAENVSFQSRTTEPVNLPAPWKNGLAAWNDLMVYGQEMLGERFLDCMPVMDRESGLEGAIYILNRPASLTTKTTHRIYLRGMLIAEKAEGFFPAWAFFVRGIINTRNLRPTVSREAFYEDENLAKAASAVGKLIQDYLTRVAETNQPLLGEIIKLHYLPLKSLCCENEEFFKFFVHYLPFETSLGSMSFRSIVARQKCIRHVSDMDQYRQIARVAVAQGVCVINAAYVYDTELLERAMELLPELDFERVDALDLTDSFQDLSEAEIKIHQRLLDEADRALAEFDVAAQVKGFKPVELPTFLSMDESAQTLRRLEKTKEISERMFGELMEQISSDIAESPHNILFFNHFNPLTAQLSRIKNPEILRKMIRLLYVQSLLLGQHPLKEKELKVLNTGLHDLIAWCAVQAGGSHV